MLTIAKSVVTDIRYDLETPVVFEGAEFHYFDLVVTESTALDRCVVEFKPMGCWIDNVSKRVRELGMKHLRMSRLDGLLLSAYILKKAGKDEIASEQMHLARVYASLGKDGVRRDPSSVVDDAMAALSTVFGLN